MASISKAGFSNSEESGWTTYFDDFFDNHKSCSISSSVVNNSSSSLVSDATSLNLAAKKATYSDDDNDQAHRQEFSVNENVIISCRRSNLRKRKKPQAVDSLIIDDVLQDTATSDPLINTFKKKGSRSSDRKEMYLKAGRHSR